MRQRTARTSERASRAPRRWVIDPPSDVVLWRPRIVLTSTIGSAPPRPAGLTAADPAFRPAPVIAQVGAAGSLLRAVEDTRHHLAEAEARARDAGSERERVSVTMETFRLEAAFDEVLVDTWEGVTAIMEERGLR